MRKNAFQKKFHAIRMFIPFAFKRYTLTSGLAVFVVIMTISSFFSGPSKVQLFQKNKPRNPAEYQITIYAPKLEKTYEDLWVDGVTALLKQNHFNCYPWIYKGRRVIDVIGIFDKEADIQRIKTLVQENGLLKDEVTFDSGIITNRIDTYDIEIEPDNMSLSDKRMWGKGVVQLLLSKGYISTALDSGNVMVQHVSYPPFQEAYNIVAFLEESGLKIPSAFSIYENEPPDGYSEDLTFRIEASHHTIRMSGYVPFKKFDPLVHHENSVFIVKIIDPEGKVSVAKIKTHPVTGFSLRYPQDFLSKNDVLKGLYQVNCFLNDRNVLNTKFQLDPQYDFAGHHDAEPRRVFYSRLEK